MALTESMTERINIGPDGQMQVTTYTTIFRDGIQISRTPHSRVIYPGHDVSKESSDIQEYARIAHTPEKVAAFNAAIVAAQAQANSAESQE